MLLWVLSCRELKYRGLIERFTVSRELLVRDICRYPLSLDGDHTRRQGARNEERGRMQGPT